MAIARKDNPHTVAAASGRLSYRRVFPPELRSHIAKLGLKATELKRSLSATRMTDPGAAERWQAANAEWETIVAQASKMADRRYDTLSAADAARLAEGEEREWHIADERELAARGEEFAEAAWNGWEEMLSEYKRWRIEQNIDEIVGRWGSSAQAIIGAHHIVLDPDDTAGFHALCTALNDRAIAYSGPAKSRLKGDIVPIPPEPVAVQVSAAHNSPIRAKSFEDIAQAILSSPRHPIGPSTQQAAATALRFFREAFGPLPPAKITKAVVSEWLDLLAARPNRVAADERQTPIRELVDRYKDRETPRLSAKTMSTQLGALSALWNKAQREEGTIDERISNPFVGRASLATRPPETPQELSASELEAIFSLPIFTRGERPRGGKGEASYWIPLLLLWTGARPEEVAQLLVSDIYQDPDSSEDRWLIRITDEGMHPHKGRQSLKTSKKRTGRRTFPVPQPLIDLGLPAYLEHLRARRETALFPELRTKGERNLLFAGWGEWWSSYLQERNVLPEAEGRRASREFRHNWTTAARKSGIPEDAREYIQGHRRANASANQGYGSKSPLGEWAAKLTYSGVDLTGLKAWTASPMLRPASSGS